MKKTTLSIIAVILSTMFLSSCGTRPVDNANHNQTFNKDIKIISGCDVYYNIGTNMTEYIDIDRDKYTDIIYAAAGVARSTWHNGDNKFFVASLDIKEEDFDFLNTSIIDKTKYKDGLYSILNSVLENVSSERASIVITDLQSDLNDYSKISESIVNNVLKKIFR